MIEQAQLIWWYLRAMSARRGFFDRSQWGEEGSAVETVILTAIFAALAIAIGAIIVSKITAKANSINLN